MKIILETQNGLSDKELEILRLLDPERQAANLEILSLKEKIRELEQKREEPVLPKGRQKSAREDIIELFKLPNAMYTAIEMGLRLNRSPASMYQEMWKLRQEKFLDSTGSRPVRFFRRAGGGEP